MYDYRKGSGKLHALTKRCKDTSDQNGYSGEVLMDLPTSI